VTIYSDDICEDLDKNFRILPRKTLKLDFPKNLPEMYYKDYIRGYIDGDGTLSYFKDKTSNRFSLSYAGNCDFIKDCASKLEIPFYDVKIKDTLHIISYSPHNSIKVAYILGYCDYNIFCLERKRNKYKEFINNVMTNTQEKRFKTQNELFLKDNNLNSIKDIFTNMCVDD